MWDRLFVNGQIATLDANGTPYGLIPDGAVAVAGARIAWVGPRADLPGAPADLARAVVSLDGGCLLPGLIDGHTHLVYGGDRAGEFEQRLTGVSYAEIAAQGGGIRATVAATRAADAAALKQSARARLNDLMAEGVTTVEIKSGYGLDLATEARQLRVARALGAEAPVRVVTSFLGAHTLPPAYEGGADAYIDAVADTMLPAIAAEGLADAVDAFGEHIAFTPEQVARVFTAARAHGLPVKLHADQLSDQGGAALAAAWGALSADHLEYTSAAGAAAMGRAGTVATLLPGAFFYLRETQVPPVAAFRNHGVAMAVASDSNPGSSPVTSLQAMMTFACVLFGLTPEEAVAGVTRNAARALGLQERRGRIAPGLDADLSLWDVASPAEIVYRLGDNRCTARYVGGQPV